MQSPVDKDKQQYVVDEPINMADISTGMVIKSPNGDKWLVTVGDGGVLTYDPDGTNTWLVTSYQEF